MNETAYIILTDAGIRMFDEAEHAASYDGKDGFGKNQPIPVVKEKHYRGKIGAKRGVLFTDCDQSFGELLGTINNY